jgi:Flp pilus assembly pilin Flp
VGGNILICAVKCFWRDESGQDLIEYSLLLAFIALAAVGIISGVGDTTTKLWSTLNVDLLSAKAAAS